MAKLRVTYVWRGRETKEYQHLLNSFAEFEEWFEQMNRQPIVLVIEEQEKNVDGIPFWVVRRRFGVEV